MLTWLALLDLLSAIAGSGNVCVQWPLWGELLGNIR